MPLVNDCVLTRVRKTLEKFKKNPVPNVFKLERNEQEYKYSVYKQQLQNPDITLKEKESKERYLRRFEKPNESQPMVRYGLTAKRGRSAGVGGVALRYIECMLDACLLSRTRSSIPPSKIEAWERLLGNADTALVKELYADLSGEQLQKAAQWFTVVVFEMDHKTAARAIREEIMDYEEKKGIPSDHHHASIGNGEGGRKKFNTRLLDAIKRLLTRFDALLK